MAGSFYKWLLIPVFFGFVNMERIIPLVPERDSAIAAHPFYVAVTEINHNTSAKTLEITSKIFLDDFEKVLTQKNKVVVSISQPKEKKVLDAQISQYVRDHLSLKIDSKDAPLNYLGFEKEGDAVYCYLEAVSIPSIKKLEVKNSLLHDLNNNQINIIHINAGGSRKSHKLNFPDTEFVISY